MDIVPRATYELAPSSSAAGHRAARQTSSSAHAAWLLVRVGRKNTGTSRGDQGHVTLDAAVDERTQPSTHQGAAYGVDARSRYAEVFWLPAVGPTALWFLRFAASALDARPAGVLVRPEVLARCLGVGGPASRFRPLERAIARLMAFGLVIELGPPRQEKEDAVVTADVLVTAEGLATAEGFVALRGSKEGAESPDDLCGPGGAGSAGPLGAVREPQPRFRGNARGASYGAEVPRFGEASEPDPAFRAQVRLLGVRTVLPPIPRGQLARLTEAHRRMHHELLRACALPG
jgi:hypothetical protein